MLKEKKKTLILTTIVMILPMIIGFLLWDKLPDKIPTHWNIEGEVDGWSGKIFAVLGLPAILIGIHWLCVFATVTDPKKKNIEGKMFDIVLWITPVISVVMTCVVYAIALGREFPVEKIVPALVGVMFVVIGNYLPKCKQSYTVGIKLPWTLNDEDNWNRTHRLTGKLWVVCGFVMIIGMFLPSTFGMVVLFSIIMLSSVIPGIYSYCLYKKKEASGE